MGSRSCATRTAMVRTDPFYPYLTHMGNPRARSSTSSRPLIFPLWRGLVQSDAGLEHRLQGLPPHFVVEFRLQNSEGRSAQGEGDWERAISRFLHCKTLLEAEKVNIAKQTYDWLLAWADLPLAQLYQLRGSAEMSDSDQRVDMLKKALKIRREILACIKPLFRLNPLLAMVCESYCYTAQYEWGCLTSSEAKNEAVQEYAELFGCDKSVAEARLCLLLYIDHYYAGSFDISLSWIQAANRLGKELSPDGSHYPPYFLEREVELLMKLEKFPEAVTALSENLQPHATGVSASIIHHWLKECYTQMSKKAALDGNVQQAEEYEQSAEIQHALKCSLSSEESQENVFVGPSDSPLNCLPTYHPILKATPCPDLGSSLGLVQADHGFELYLRKLPAPISVLFGEHCQLAKFSQERGDWEGAICEYQMGREFLKIIQKVLDKEAHDWLLTWVDLPLANLYHYRAMKYEKAVEIRQEMLDCALKHQMPSIEHLSSGHWTVLAAVEFEWKYSSTSDAKYEIVQQYAKSCNLCDKRAEHDLCFWLYFGHYLHGSLEASLKWLREAKRLQEQRSPDRKCSSYDYFCCVYDYLRCEADLLMKLQRFEEAASALEILLGTRHVHQGSLTLAREARQWLQKCYMQMRKSASADEEEMADLQRALECSLITDNHQQEGTADQLSSLTGCIKLDHTNKLVQSKAGLEQHLHKLPAPIHLAFRKHSDLALAIQGIADWETTTFQFEWCREILKISRTRIEKESYDWLLVWVDLPLVHMYQFKKMQFKKAFDIWREMFCSIPWDTDDRVSILRVTPLLAGYFHAAMYQYAISDFPDSKDGIVKSYGLCIQCLDDWASEECLLTILQDEYWNSSNYEVSLRFTREAKRLFEQNFSGDGHDKKNAYVFKEARSLICLGRFEDAKVVLNEYTGGTDDAQDKRVDLLRKTCYRKNISDAAQMEVSDSSNPLLQLRLDSFSFEENEQYEEAVKCHTTCLDMIDKRRNDSGGLDIALHDYYHQPGFYDNYRLGVLHMIMSLRSMSSFSCAQLKGRPCPDANFLRAVQYFERSIELSLPLTDSQDVALVNLQLLHLYGIFDYAVYGSYLMTLYVRARKKMNSAASTSDIAASLKILFVEIDVYLNLPNSIEHYGRRALLQYASLLYTTERYTENYIEVLDNHKMLYAHLQDHYCRRSFLLHIFNGLYVLGSTSKDYEERVQFYKWRAFMYAEGERTRVMLYQLLGPKRLNYDASRRLWGFDFDDDIAMKDIQETCANLFKGDTVFVQYSRWMDGESYFIYVIDQDGKLSVTHTRMDDELTRVTGPKRNTLETRLKNLHNYFEGRRVGRGYNDDSMNRDLEFLYDMLMRPIAAYLDKMKPEHKLILAPSELLTKVPFAALRDSTRQPGQMYLIERHTISFTSSLRVLRVCSDRLQDLQSSQPLYPCRGSIIALGDPEYGDMYPPLEESGKEVSYMASLFGESAVVKLLREDATAKQLLLWAEKPSHESFRQAIIHIGAHGVVNEEDHTKSFLRLARPASSSSAGNENYTRSRGKQLDDEQEPEEDYSEKYDEIEMDNEADTSSAESSMFPLVMTRRFQWKYQGSSSGAMICKASRSGPSMRESDFYDLTAEDISGSETMWRAELVVLSACRTAQGKRTAEGVLSLTRAFMIAGVPCVVASQWEVLDDATYHLMRHFYKKLRTGKEDVATALRSSMLEMLKADNHPVRAWAPFAVWGAPTLRIPHCLQQNDD